MKKTLSMVLAFIFCFSLTTIFLSSSAKAFSFEDEVKFELKDVKVDGDMVSFKGVFINQTDSPQKVIGLYVNYLVYDEETTAIVTGKHTVENLEVAVDKDVVEYNFTVKEPTAIMTRTEDVYGWRIESSVVVEE